MLVIYLWYCIFMEGVVSQPTTSLEQATVHGAPGWSGQQILSPPGFMVQILLLKVPQSFSIINGSGMNHPNDLYLTKDKTR